MKGKMADYAFAPCNNVDNWKKYMQKEADAMLKIL